MKTRRVTVIILVAFVLIISGICGMSLAKEKTSYPYELVLTLYPSGKTLLVFPLCEREIFGIRYIHSVDIKPIFEIFEVQPGGVLALRETYFKMFGAGMGYIKGRGILGSDGEWIWIKDIHEPVNGFILRVGSKRVAHTLLYRAREINLSQYWAGKRIRFTLRHNLKLKQNK